MNNVSALREHLFEAIKGVKDGSLSIEQAKAVSDLSQTIINSAKVEVDYARATGAALSSGFLDNSKSKQLPNGVVSIRKHVLQG